MTIPKEIRIGILLTLPRLEKKKDELVCENKERWWLKDVQNKYCIKRQNKNCCPGDVSIGKYIESKYKIKVDYIMPREITKERLKKNTVNFMLIYDLLEAFHSSKTPEKKRRYQELVKVLSEAKNIYPPYDYQQLINDKSKYIKHLSKKKKTRVIPTFSITRQQYNRFGKTHQQRVQKTAQSIINRAKKQGWKKFIAKPIFGQESIGFKAFDPEKIEQQVPKYVDKMFNDKKTIYPGILIQKYIEGFDKENPEIRMYFIDEDYKYSVITTDTKVTIPKNEKGTEPVPGFNQLKLFAKQTLKGLPPIKINGKKLPKLLTRIDIACQQKFKKPWVCNEVEFVPSLYIEDINGIPEIPLGDGMVKIARIINGESPKIKTHKMKFKTQFGEPQGFMSFWPFS